MSTTGRDYVAAPPYVARAGKDTTASRLQTDTSTDTIFYAIWAGALVYAVAREGVELSKVTSAALAAATGTAVYSQWWKWTVAAAARVSSITGTMLPRSFPTRQ
jgi:hypothetical protein